MHCQICLIPVPDHSPNCPVATGQPVMGGDQLDWVQRMPQGASMQMMSPGSMAMMGHNAVELRLEWLEKEVHKLRARIAKLERGP